MRKMAHGLLNTSVAKSYGTYQILENTQMLRDMLHTPDDFLEHIRRYSNSLTTSMTYGQVMILHGVCDKYLTVAQISFPNLR